MYSSLISNSILLWCCRSCSPSGLEEHLPVTSQQTQITVSGLWPYRRKLRWRLILQVVKCVLSLRCLTFFCRFNRLMASLEEWTPSNPVRLFVLNMRNFVLTLVNKVLFQSNLKPDCNRLLIIAVSHWYLHLHLWRFSGCFYLETYTREINNK